MIRCLLWNTQRKPLDGLVLRLVKQHKLHVLILVEHPKPDTAFFQILGQNGHWRKIESHDRFGLYVRFNQSHVERVKPVTDIDRVDYFRLRRASDPDVLMVLVHGYDKRSTPSDDTRRVFFERLTENVLSIERSMGHKRTIVAGDFNANPFETAVGSAQGLHAINMREVNGKKVRTVVKREYPFFYNPMWSCYGSGLSRPPASYYFYEYGGHEIFWHMHDQVVLRPDAVEFFDEKRLRILTEAGGVDLLTNRGVPDRTGASDHLPILFQLRI